MNAYLEIFVLMLREAPITGVDYDQHGHATLVLDDLQYTIDRATSLDLAREAWSVMTESQREQAVLWKVPIQEVYQDSAGRDYPLFAPYGITQVPISVLWTNGEWLHRDYSQFNMLLTSHIADLDFRNIQHKFDKKPC